MLLKLSSCLIAVSAWFFLSSPLEASAAEPCECIDQADLKHRLEETETAMKAFEQQLQAVGKDKHSEAGYQKVGDAVQGELNEAVKGRLPTKASGGTTRMCMVEVNEQATQCIKEGTFVHEEVHAEACSEWYGPISIAVVKAVVIGAERWDTMGDYIQEELKGYRTEQEYLKKQMARLESSCIKPEIDYTAQKRKRDYTSQERSQPEADPLKDIKEAPGKVFKKLFGF